MGNTKMSGVTAAAVACVAIAAIAILEGMALWQGIDGTQFMGVIAVIAALGGAAAGVKIGDFFKK